MLRFIKQQGGYFMNEKFYTTRELAEMLGVQVNTLEIWRWRGTGPRFIKAGRLIRYREEDIQNWIQANIHGSTSEVSG